MLAKSTPSIEVKNTDDKITGLNSVGGFPTDDQSRETKVPPTTPSFVKKTDEGDEDEGEEDEMNEDEMNEDEMDEDEGEEDEGEEDEMDGDEMDEEDGGDDDYVDECDDEEEDSYSGERLQGAHIVKHANMFNTTIGFNSDSDFPSEIKKIKVIDDEENIIDLTNEGDFPTDDRIFLNGMKENGENEEYDNAHPYQTTLSFNSFFPQINEHYEMNNEVLDIDMRILNLHSLHELHPNERVAGANSEDDDWIFKNKIVEVLEDEDETYDDMPALEPVEDVRRVEHYLDDISLKVNATNTADVQDITDISLNSSIEEDVKEGQVPPITELEGKITAVANTKESEKMGGYRKLSVQTLRELAVSKGLVQDASKLKKGELLNILMV
jgi:hypothetical protein